MRKILAAVASVFGRMLYDLATMRCRAMDGCIHATEEGYPADCEECRACISGDNSRR